MKKFSFVLLLAAFFGISLGSYSRDPLSEEGASQLIFKHLEKALPPRGLSIRCVSLFTEETTRLFYQFAVREKHGEKCPGDPAVAPLVDRFRVIKKNGKIQRYDVVNDSWGK